VPIPQVDPMPLPGPLWLLRGLLLLTFVLHLLLMNSLVGGALTALVCGLRRRRSAHAAQLATELARRLPVLFSLTITLGVAPLLFLQVLYGRLFYASSILMGAPWIAVIAMVVASYYGVYYFSLAVRKGRWSGAVVPVLGAALALLAIIAFVYSNNLTLMLDPGRWAGIYGRSASGWNLNWSEPTLLPRYLHFLLSALALTGLMLVTMGIGRRQTEYGRWLLEQGSQLFLGPTLLNFAVGFWWLVWLPARVRTSFLGQDWVAMLVLGLGFISAIGAVMHLVLAKAKSGKSADRNAWMSIAAAVVTVASMVVLRDALRTAYLAPYFRVDQVSVASQTGIIALFFLVFLIGLAVVAWMLRKVAQGAKPAATLSAD